MLYNMKTKSATRLFKPEQTAETRSKKLDSKETGH